MTTLDNSQTIEYPPEDGDRLVDKIRVLYENDNKWYRPTEEELNQAVWLYPRWGCMDGINRSYCGKTKIYRAVSYWTNKTYYFKENGGNMTSEQIAAAKREVPKEE